ncbi:hypothetical protein A3B57_04155 [Microgenomates group bacterium RIFCSPLOWO2_01_FULL_47_10]|nr:MAG: hypothetical protein A3B57_04155 [Microgenomates group bacterium RIFCSPLOWO2_01_FULL_47_10]
MKFFLRLFAGIILASLAIGAWVYYQTTPVSPVQTPTTFIIKKGETVARIGQNLKSKNLIRSPGVFKLYVMVSGITQNIQAGSFKLSENLTTPAIARSLTSGRQDIWVTVLEGWRREEIADSLENAFTAAGAGFDRAVFLTATRGMEGQLFPDTYLFPLDSNEDTIASIMTNTLDTKLTPLLADITKSGYTQNQILTMASIIEREAKNSNDRKMVSGILWQRIENNWPLQVDATLQYAKGYDAVQKTWWKPPLAIDKAIKSPYNTYLNPGLPPGPICSPSLDSIVAALAPTPSDYWFYITDGQGVMHYAKTAEQHNQNVQTYLR